MTYISYVTRIRSEGILAFLRDNQRGAGKLSVSHILGFINSSEIPLTTV